MDARLKKQLDFITEIDKAKNVFRQNYNTDGKRRENDAEHSWHIAVMALVLGEYSPEGTDIIRVVQMALVHDLVEIDAGDTYAYDAAACLDKRERELAAAERIFNILPDEQAAYARELWDEFEECVSNEARFCRAMDILQPVMMNAPNGRSWHEHGITRDKPQERIEHIKSVSPKLWQAADEILAKAAENGKFCS